MQKFYRKVLGNGMTIILEKRDLPVASLAFAVRIGGINESSLERGISHFVEHLIYKGTRTRNATQIAAEIEKRGGILNGFTDELITAFWCKIPSKHLNAALEVLSDMVKNPVFDEKEIEKERNVILEEIKMYRDSPTKHANDEIQGCLYEEPFGISLIGTEKTLKSIDRKKILKRFYKFYQPSNLILCVVGNANFNRLMNFARKNFSNKKMFFDSRSTKFKITTKNTSKTEKRKDIDQAHFVFAYHTPTLKHSKAYTAILLNFLMVGGMSSRLFHEIREKRNLAYSVAGSAEIHEDYAYSTVYVGTKKEAVEEIKKIILDEFKKVSNDLTEKELADVKEQVIGNNQILKEDSSLKLFDLLYYEIDGNAKNSYEFEKKIQKIKLKEVKELAKIPLKKSSSFLIMPE